MNWRNINLLLQSQEQTNIEHLRHKNDESLITFLEYYIQYVKLKKNSDQDKSLLTLNGLSMIRSFII